MHSRGWDCHGTTLPTRCPPPLAVVLGAVPCLRATFSTVASSLMCAAKSADEYTACQLADFRGPPPPPPPPPPSATPIKPTHTPFQMLPNIVGPAQRHYTRGDGCEHAAEALLGAPYPRGYAPPPRPHRPRGAPLAVRFGRCAGNGATRRACDRHQRRHHGCQPHRRRPW